MTDYLTNKIKKVNLNNQKANRGGVLIKTHRGWEDKIEQIVSLTFQIIQSQFVRNNTTYTVGECGLTYVSMAAGKMIAPIICREPIGIPHQLALGDLLIEGFVYHGFVELIPPVKRHEKYMIKAAPKWVELADLPVEVVKEIIIGSFINRQGVDRSAHKMHEELFEADAPYVRAMDNLQGVKWSINRPVLDQVLNYKHLFAPDEPITDNDAKEQRRRSKVIEWAFITKKAEALRDWDGFYQTFEVDYRGRMYNTEPFLNYQGNDLAKGLLLFSTPQPINESGQFWLAVHTAASYNQSYNIDEIPDWCEEDYVAYLESEGLDNISVDKMTLNDRAAWTMNNWDKIFECKLDMKAEKPITFLACCYEWVEVSETGLTCLPVAIDGSNNGWQHLGAISKDPETGLLVGLVPVDIQKDFYVQTARELISLTTDEELKEILDNMPMKHIRKGISKRGSMTRAYSAGASKIAENMFFDCKTEDFHEKYGITLKHCNKLASTLVKAIENVCPGPLKTMAYLQSLAQYRLGKHELVGGCKKEYKDLLNRRSELLALSAPIEEELEELNDIVLELDKFYYELNYGEGDDFITWETPSGFKAKYEKYHMVDMKLRATLNGKVVKHVLKEPTDKPDIHGFMCGISPNFIHSMDAAHMALVIDGWEGDFGAVHDSFSTHANNVDSLLQKTKDVFIEMYNHDNYFDVIREQLTNNKDNIEQPALGNLDIGGIDASNYFFA